MQCSNVMVLHSSSYITWEGYSKTLIDAAVPKGLLDYFDFHSYGGNGEDNSKTFIQVRQQKQL